MAGRASDDPASAKSPPVMVRVDPPPEPVRMTLEAWQATGDPEIARNASLLRDAREGDAIAQWRLGVMISNGQIAGGTLAEAVSLFEASAAQGLTSALVSLGIMHAQGRGTVRDYAAARQTFELAARSGDALGFYHLGVMHYQGHGTGANHQEAMGWMLAAAELGSDAAKKSLKEHFDEEGLDVDQAKRRANELLREFEGRS